MEIIEYDGRLQEGLQESADEHDVSEEKVVSDMVKSAIRVDKDGMADMNIEYEDEDDHTLVHIDGPAFFGTAKVRNI